MKHFLPITYNSAFPKPIDGFSKTFKQIALERAKELLSTGKRINVMWSGGLDSTAVLFSLLSQCTDTSKIRVILTYDSVVESAGLFDRHVYGKLDYVLTTRLPRDLAFATCNFDLNNDLVVSGALADQVLDALKLDNPLSDKFIDSIKLSTNMSPRPLITTKDYEWFSKFTFSWDAIKYSQQFGLDKKYHHMIKPFYDTDDFQRWSILGKDQPDHDSGHKSVSRALIAELSGETDYAFNKPKTVSAHTISDFNRKAFLDNSGNTAYFDGSSNG
jgi:hypothetical protein